MNKNEIRWTIRGLVAAVILAVLYSFVTIMLALLGHPLPDEASTVMVYVLAAVLMASQIPMLRRFWREMWESK